MVVESVGPDVYSVGLGLLWDEVDRLVRLPLLRGWAVAVLYVQSSIQISQ